MFRAAIKNTLNDTTIVMTALTLFVIGSGLSILDVNEVVTKVSNILLVVVLTLISLYGVIRLLSLPITIYPDPTFMDVV